MEVIRNTSGYYLKNNKGRIDLTSDISKASKFQNGAAQIYIDTQVKKVLRQNYHVEKIDTKLENTTFPNGQTNTTSNDKSTPNITSDETTQVKEVKEIISDNCDDCYVSKCDIDKIVSDFTELIKQVNLCKPVLEEQLS